MQGENRNKVYTIFVLCLGVVVAVWLLSRNSMGTQLSVKNVEPVSAFSYKNTDENISDDWKKLLSDNPQNQVATQDLTKSSATFDETTLTAQMAKDFFSQYLIASKKGTPISASEADQIARNTLSLPDYTKDTGPVYVETNLRVTEKVDKETVKKYRDTLNLYLKNRSAEIKDEPMLILKFALQKEDASELSKLDPIIAACKGIVSDMLSIEVPKDAVEAHLLVLNAFSNIVSNVEAMKYTFTDPVKAFAGLSQYNNHFYNIKTTLSNLDQYFLKKLGPPL